MSVIPETREKLPRPQFGDGIFNPHRLHVEDYEKMIEHGIFGEDERIELWEGVLITMRPKGSKHANAVGRIDRSIKKKLGEQIVFSAQDPIRLDDYSEPEPDVALLAPPIENYDDRHPTPKDIFLVVEIADTSIEKDRRKAGNYARNGICQYLLLNLNTDEIEDYREPAADGYRFKKIHDAAASFNLVAFPEVEIKVADLFPPEGAETR
jgi:Uma2 family endonuclease